MTKLYALFCSEETKFLGNIMKNLLRHRWSHWTSFLVTMTTLLTLFSYVTAKGILSYGAECDWNFSLTHSAFRAARDEVLCNTDKRLTCFNSVCQCQPWLEWEHDNCVTALFRPCSNASQCVSNAKCERRDDLGFKACECKDGYHDKDGLCADDKNGIVAATRAPTTVPPKVPSGPDCVYIKCKSEADIKGLQDPGFAHEYLNHQNGLKSHPSSKNHQPCAITDGRGHLGDMSCPKKNGTVIHMCCRYRQDVQESRQSRFRTVTGVADWLSGENCVKRVLCEQACRDRVKGKSASSFPMELPTDGESDKEYVRAYLTGEGVVVGTMYCCEEDRMTCINSVRTLRCDKECSGIFPGCEEELTESWRTWAFVKSSSAFHSVGMWLFNAEWIVRDKLAQAWAKTKDIGVAVKEAYGNLFERMTKLSKGFREWLQEKAKGRRRRDVGAEDWEEFLLIYSSTDAVLVGNVVGVLSHAEFENVRNSINETLATQDFQSEEWVYTGGSPMLMLPFVHLVAFLIFLVSAFLV